MPAALHAGYTTNIVPDRRSGTEIRGPPACTRRRPCLSVHT